MQQYRGNSSPRVGPLKLVRRSAADARFSDSLVLTPPLQRPIAGREPGPGCGCAGWTAAALLCSVGSEQGGRGPAPNQRGTISEFTFTAGLTGSILERRSSQSMIATQWSYASHLRTNHPIFPPCNNPSRSFLRCSFPL